MSSYIDGELAAADRARLEAHLAACPHCSEYLRQLRVTIDALGTVDVDALPDEMVDALVSVYREWAAGDG
jgi:anti-sigma factor RsiW